MRVVVTGGAGYIGSHTVTLFLQAGHDVLIIDNFANAAEDVPDRVAGLAGREAIVLRADITQPESYLKAFEDFAPDAVVHFAGLKAVAEAVADPLEYYRVNVGGSLTLFRIMQGTECRRLVFSSSATVYGDPERVPIDEGHPCRPTNPYGRSKLMVEEIVEDWGRSDDSLAAINLRYFNPVGAHPSARIGEAPNGVPNNLMPYISDVAQGRRERLQVFGDDYGTPDGTGVRDYIHVMDLADAHLAALELTGRASGVEALNVGTGEGYSVLEMVRAFESASGRSIPYDVVARRPGDVAISLADPAMAEARMGWKANLGLDEMCRDAWAFTRGRNT